MTVDEIELNIIQFIEKNVLKSADEKIDSDTPLLEWGILDSISTAKLLAFIRERMDVYVPPHQIVGARFKTAGTIAELVHGLLAEPSARV